MASQEWFEELVQAIVARDSKVLEALRTHWHPIREHVRELRGEPALAPDDRARLILWLSTPPDSEPVDWSEIHADAAFVLEERTQDIDQAHRLWGLWERWVTDAWDDSHPLRAATKGERPLAPLWGELAERWFREALDWDRLQRDTNDGQTRLDAVAGYEAGVRELLLRQRVGLSKARLDILPDPGVRPLRLQDGEGTRERMEVLGGSIAFRSGLETDLATPLSLCVSFALPVFDSILTEVQVEHDEVGCHLSSAWEDPHALYDRLEFEDAPIAAARSKLGPERVPVADPGF